MNELSRVMGVFLCVFISPVCRGQRGRGNLRGDDDFVFVLGPFLPFGGCPALQARAVVCGRSVLAPQPLRGHCPEGVDAVLSRLFNTFMTSKRVRAPCSPLLDPFNREAGTLDRSVRSLAPGVVAC